MTDALSSGPETSSTDTLSSSLSLSSSQEATVDEVNLDDGRSP